MRSPFAKTALFLSVSVALAALLASATSLDVSLTAPQYVVLHSFKTYEIREYAQTHPNMWVSTTVKGESFKDASSTAFHRLFGYISGQNIAKEHIPMTKPVVMTWVDAKGEQVPMTMSFYVPPPLSHPPVPTEKDVLLNVETRMVVAVRKFGGFADAEDAEREVASLHADLDRDGITRANDGFSLAVYNSPFRVISRHNEVWVPVTFSTFAEHEKLMDAKLGSDVPTVKSLDLKKYLGRFFQMYDSRIASWTVERNAFCATADYGLGSDGKVSVFNSEHYGSVTGPYHNITGYAYIPDQAYPGRLKVHLAGVPYDGDYWVLELGPVNSDGLYSYAIVSDRHKASLFILARDPAEFDSKYRETVLAKVKDLGFTHFYNQPVLTVQNGCTYPPKHFG